QKDLDDRLKMFQDAEKEEIDSRITFDTDKIKEIKSQTQKELDLNTLETSQKVENLKKEQEKMGGSSENFQREIDAINTSGKNKAVGLQRKETDEINAEYQRKWEIQSKILDRQIKDAEAKYTADTNAWLKAQQDKFKSQDKKTATGDAFNSKVQSQTESVKSPLEQLKDQHAQELQENAVAYKNEEINLAVAKENEQKINDYFIEKEVEAKQAEIDAKQKLD